MKIFISDSGDRSVGIPEAYLKIETNIEIDDEKEREEIVKTFEEVFGLIPPLTVEFKQ